MGNPRESDMSVAGGLRRIAYLGPEGTFTHQALERFGELRGYQSIPYASVGEVIQAVENCQVDAGVVPIENSMEGAVTATLDGLAASGGNVQIAGEAMLPIQFDIFVSRGMEEERLKEAISHPHAIAQCRKYIERKQLQTVGALSTAEACRQLRDQPQPGVGAIASPKAGEIYGLSAVDREVQDVSGAVTRFVLLVNVSDGSKTAGAFQALAGLRPAFQRPTGRDKSSLILTPKHDRPGSLVELLKEFSSRRINLTRIESRPMKTQLGRYCFFIDVQGHVEDKLIVEALQTISSRDVEITFLGSYPFRLVSDESTPAARKSSARKGNFPRAIRSAGICGLGMIGGSMARALKAIADVEVRGFDPNYETRRAAEANGIKCVDSMAELVSGVDLVVAAPPVSKMDSVLREMAGLVHPEQILTDVSSIKGPIVEAAAHVLPKGISFIGGHPMAGSSRSGFGAGRAELFRGSSWVLVFDNMTTPESFIRLTELLLRLDARVVPMSAAAHDEAVSVISHLPHVIAYILMELAIEKSAGLPTLELAAGSFRDLVRVAGSSPETWADICRINAPNVSASLKIFRGALEEASEHIRNGENSRRLTEFFEKGFKGYCRMMDSAPVRREVEIPTKAAEERFVSVMADIASTGGWIEELRVEGGKIIIGVASRRAR